MREQAHERESAPNRGSAAERLAEELRALRQSAGSPSFRSMAAMTHYSSSSLAEATSGRRLPSRPVVEAFARACGADPAAWAETWQAAVTEAAAMSATEPTVEEPPAHRPVRAARLVLSTALVGAGFAAGALLHIGSPTAAVVNTAPRETAAPHLSAPAAVVADGVDPAAAGCTADAQMLDKAVVLAGAAEIGALELKYSPRCHAGWARLYLYPGQATMFGTVRVQAASGAAAEFDNPLKGQLPVYTDVIRPDGGCLKARGQVFATGRPPVTVEIACTPPAHG